MYLDMAKRASGSSHLGSDHKYELFSVLEMGWVHIFFDMNLFIYFKCICHFVSNAANYWI